MFRILIIVMLGFLQACSQTFNKPVPMADNVDINRFMGDWYVVANIPTFIEVGAHNAVESYELKEDGSIATTFKFNADSFDGDLKIYEPTGYVSKENTSIWGMQFIWPFKAEFIIAYLSDDYQHTIIARNARDYVWVMSRNAEIPESTYQSLIKRCIEMGYEVKNIKRIPHEFLLVNN